MKYLQVDRNIMEISIHVPWYSHQSMLYPSFFAAELPLGCRNLPHQRHSSVPSRPVHRGPWPSSENHCIHHQTYGCLWLIHIFLTYIWLWLWRMMIHNDLGNCVSLILNFKKPNGVFVTSRHVGTRRPMSPVDPGTCVDFRFHLRKHGEFYGEFTISWGWMLSWMLFLNFNLRNAKNGFGSVEGCLLHSGIRYISLQSLSLVLYWICSF